MVEALLNNETYFFRDRTPFDTLLEHALPALAAKRASKKRIRIWSAGCSTGQEAYSLAMLFAERAEQVARLDDRHPRHRRLALRASIARASGVYTQFEVQRGLGITQIIRWFEEAATAGAIAEPLRKHVRFQVHNLLEPPPHPGSFDIVLCRNVLLYLCAEKKALAFERLPRRWRRTAG